MKHTDQDRSERVYVQVTFEAAMAEALRRIAAAEDRSMTGEIRRLVRQRIESYGGLPAEHGGESA